MFARLPRRVRSRPAGEASYGTRARVFPAIGAGLVALGVLHQLVSNTAIAVNFSTTDDKFRIYSNYVQGVYGAGYLASHTGYTDAGNDGIAQIGFRSVKLAGLCAIAHETLPNGTDISFMVLAGAPVNGSFDDSRLTTTDGAGEPIELDTDGQLTGASASEAVVGTDMFLNSDLLSGYAHQLSGLDLGRSAETVHAPAELEWPSNGSDSQPQDGGFGLFAEHLNISGLDGASYGINLAGQVELPGLQVKTLPGFKTQADCQTEATG